MSENYLLPILYHPFTILHTHTSQKLVETSHQNFNNSIKKILDFFSRQTQCSSSVYSI